MPRYAVAAAMLAVMLTSTSSFALTAKQKMATCKFGADDQKLAGKARAVFLKRCMSNKNDPRGPATGMPAAAGASPPPPQH